MLAQTNQVEGPKEAVKDFVYLAGDVYESEQLAYPLGSVLAKGTTLTPLPAAGQQHGQR